MKFKAHEKTIFSITILILLCINLLPILTVTARSQPYKGKPGKGKPERQTIEITFTGNIEGTVPESHSDLVDGLLTHTRANAWGGHVEEYPLTLGSVFYDEREEPFNGEHSGTDLEMILEWTTDSGGTILFCFWFDYGEYDEVSDDNYKLLDEEGTFEFDGENYHVTLDDAEILHRLGANTRGKDKYQHCWPFESEYPKEITFTFSINY